MSLSRSDTTVTSLASDNTLAAAWQPDSQRADSLSSIARLRRELTRSAAPAFPPSPLAQSANQLVQQPEYRQKTSQTPRQNSRKVLNHIHNPCGITFGDPVAPQGRGDERTALA